MQHHRYNMQLPLIILQDRVKNDVERGRPFSLSPVLISNCSDGQPLIFFLTPAFRKINKKQKLLYATIKRTLTPFPPSIHNSSFPQVCQNCFTTPPSWPLVFLFVLCFLFAILSFDILYICFRHCNLLDFTTSLIFDSLQVL